MQVIYSIQHTMHGQPLGYIDDRVCMTIVHEFASKFIVGIFNSPIDTLADEITHT